MSFAPDRERDEYFFSGSHFSEPKNKLTSWGETGVVDPRPLVKNEGLSALKRIRLWVSYVSRIPKP